jgi:hypothetical protein
MFIRKITYLAKIDKQDFIELEIKEYDVNWYSDNNNIGNLGSSSR